MSAESERKRTRRGTTPEARELQLVALAVDLAEKQLLDGSASAQVITHYLKLGSTRERLEQQRIALENQLTAAKTKQIASDTELDKKITDAMEAMRRYSGNAPDPKVDDYED